MTARRRRGLGSISMDVEVDIAEVLMEISDQDLLDECKAREINPDKPTLKGDAIVEREEWMDLADDLRSAAASGDKMHFEVLIVRMHAMARVPRFTIQGAALVATP